MQDLKVALEVANMIDDRINMLGGVIKLDDDAYKAGTTDITTAGSEKTHSVSAKTLGGEDVKFDADQAGTYIKLDGMPGGSDGVFDMGSTEGAMAVGLYQQMTDTLAQGLTSTTDQAKKIDTQIKRSMNS